MSRPVPDRRHAKGGGVGFAACDGGIQDSLDDVHAFVDELQWDRLDQDRFGSAAALVFANLNYAHPFREGNGRSSKIFMQHVAELSQFRLDFGRIAPDAWNFASAMSHPQLVGEPPNPQPLVAVFQQIATPCLQQAGLPTPKVPLSARYQPRTYRRDSGHDLSR